MHQLSPDTVTVLPNNKRRRVDSPMKHQTGFKSIPKRVPTLGTASSQDGSSIDLSQQTPMGFLPQTEKDCQRLDEWVEKLDESTVRRVLKEAAMLHPGMYTSVWTEKRLLELAQADAKRRLEREEQIKVLNFSKQIQGVNYTTNNKFRSLRTSKQYELAGEAEGSVQYDMKKICAQICPESTQDNKTKAVLALCRIEFIVAYGGGCIGVEVRKSMGQESQFMDDLGKIVGYISDSDKEYFGRREDLMTMETQPSGLASPPELVGNVPTEPQTSVSCSSQTCRLWASFHSSTNQPPQATVRNNLAIAVVRHRDIHDMVETEYDRIQKEQQEKSNEDASVLSFVSEHTKVQKILYEEYDDFPNSKKQEIVYRALGNINQTIVGIPARVRPTSNWKTKFNAFLTLLWIGRGIVDSIGMLPNAIRAQMAFGSKLVEAIDDVYETMKHTQPGFGEDEYDDDESDDDEYDDDEEDREDESEPETEPLSFSKRENRIRYILYGKHTHLRDSQQDAITYDASSKIEDQIQKISDQIQPESL
ncbi:unnamed protein product [Aureobasidium vineae]|uniref:Uncharacterized protein n=1 Tax=Aureobasidium vineae TaxID=2773715 RepID=A0A9N8JJG8_9PEZI|nr:unnamed protein product [Aureobasidium vineae]